MAGSFVCCTVLAALVQLCCESTAFSGVHFCKVFSTPQETQQQPSENPKVIKFDGIVFPYTANNSTVGSPSTSAVANSDEENKSTTEENKSTSKEMSTSEEITGMEQITSTKRTTTMPTSPRGTTKKSFHDKNPSCPCEIKSAVSFMIRIVQVWHQSRIHNLRLHMTSSSADNESVLITESWNQTFQNTSVTVSIADDMSLSFYTVIMDVTGNSTSVTCTESDVVSPREKAGKIDGSNKIDAIKANTELIFEAPLLIIGGILAVIGSLILITAIAVWRRYRKERKRHRKCAKAKKKRDQHRRGSYEMCTYEKEPSIRSRSTPDNDYSLRKFSTTTVSPSGTQTNQAASSHPVIVTPASDKSKNKTWGFYKKEQRSATKSNKCAAVCDEGDYSEVDVSEELVSVPTMRDTRVATPLVFVKAGEQQHILRKTDHLHNAKTRSLPPTEVLSENNGYSHLNRLGNLRSHCLRSQNRDSVDSSNTGVFNVNRLSSDKLKEGVGIMKDEEGGVTSEINNEEEQDHIYEAYEEQNVKIQQNNMKPINNDCPTTEPKPASNIRQPQEWADQNWRASKMKSPEVIQEDLTEKKCHGGDKVGNVGKQNTEMETMLEKHNEMHSSETCKASSLVTDNKAMERPKPMVRQSVAKVPPDENEQQADIQATRKSKTDSEEFNNKDTDDQTQIIEAAKDLKEAKLNSNCINSMPAKRSSNADKQFSVADQDNQCEIFGNEGVSNTGSNDCCDTNSQPDITETEASSTDKQLHANCMNIPTSGRYMNMDSHLSVPNGGNETEIQGDSRISNKDSDISARDPSKSDFTNQTQIIEATKDPKEAKLNSNYINIIPVKRSSNADRQSSVEGQANEHEIQGNEGVSNKGSNDCCDIRISNKDRVISASDPTKSDVTLFSSNSSETNTAIQLDVEPEAKTEDRTDNDPAALSNGQSGAQKDSHSVEDDGEVYTVVDNIVYGSWPLTEL